MKARVIQLDHIPCLVYALRVLIEAVTLGQLSIIHQFEDRVASNSTNMVVQLHQNSETQVPLRLFPARRANKSSKADI